jgi:non-ribosomal peptide synthetase component E (peptide arylation enzyme)
MRIDGFEIPPARVKAFTDAGYWTANTTNEELERLARTQPRKLAIADGRIRLSYEEYFARSQRLASLFVKLGLTADDVVAIQLPNWTEFAVGINGAMLAGVPFCQFHSDFRSREVQLVLGFTRAAALICPAEFRRFNHLQMVDELRPSLPDLKHVIAVASEVPNGAFDLRRYLDRGGPLEVDARELSARRPRGNDLARTAFTSGTTGDPKAVLHLHNTTNCALRFLNRGQKITNESVLLVFLPVGLNWGLFNILQSVYAGCSVILMDTFNADKALETIQRERVTHFCCAPAHLVSLLNASGFADYDLSSLQVIMTGGASCPIEVIGG